MNELHMYKLAIKTAWVFSPSLAIAFRELYQDISVEDGKRKGIHHLLSFITTNTSYQSMSISLFANEEQTTSINWKCLPYLIEAIHSDKTSDEEKAMCMRSIDFLTSFITNAVPVHFMIQLLSSRCFHYFHESRRLSALDNASKEYALPAVMRFIVKCLYIASIDELLFYLPQFIQLLRQDEYGYIHELLCYVASTSPRICHQMVWYLQAESNTMNTAASSSRAVHGFCGDLNGEDNLPKKCKDLLHDIYSTLPARDLAYLQHEINFFNFVTSISGYLKLNVKNKELHSSTIKTMLLPVPIPPGVYMPTAPLRKVVGIEYDSAAPMQSAAKCPFLLKFKTIAWDGPDNFLMKQSSRTAKPAAGNGKLIGDGKLQTAEELYGGFLHAKSARNLIIHESKNIMALPSKIAKNPEEFLSEPSSREPSVKVGEMKVRLRSRRIYRNPRQKNANQKPEDGNVGGEEQFPLSDSETGSQSASETPKKGKKNMTNTGGIGKRTGTFTSPKLSKYGRNPSTSMMADVPGPQTPNKGFLNNVNVSSALPPSPMKPDSIVVKKKEEDVQFDACIFKVFDDCRQDVLTLQVMRMLRNWFQVKQIPVFLAPYNILSNRTTDNALGGILEVVPNVQSRDQLGKSGVGKTLEQYFLTKFGEKGSESYVAAQYAFASSLASYSVVCYLLQIKDRHNGNIVIDNLGHIIHIDFGFILGISPGHNMRFESAPFKLSQEMVNILDGIESAVYRRYVNLTVQSYLAAREIMLPILSVVAGYAESDLPCFRFRHSILSELRKRFRSDLSDMEAGKWMESLIERARTEWTTSVYDGVQKLQNNIYSPEWK